MLLKGDAKLPQAKDCNNITLLLNITEVVLKGIEMMDFFHNVANPIYKKMEEVGFPYNKIYGRSAIDESGQIFFVAYAAKVGMSKESSKTKTMLRAAISNISTKEESLLWTMYNDVIKVRGFYALGASKAVNNRYKGTAFEQEYMEYKIVPSMFLSKNFGEIWKRLHENNGVYNFIEKQAIKKIAVQSRKDFDLTNILFS